MSDFCFALCTRVLGSSLYFSWPPTTPMTMAHLTTCKSSICSVFQIFIFFSNFSFFPRYRTLSIHVEEKSKTIPDKADAIRQIDVHTIPADLVYQRFSTSPTLGLESPAVDRLTQTFGKNVISPPKTQYWKKVLNYIFGGFNFLMWIAFTVTTVGLLTSSHHNDCSIRPFSFPTSLLGSQTLPYLIWALQSFSFVYRLSYWNLCITHLPVHLL